MNNPYESDAAPCGGDILSCLPLSAACTQVLRRRETDVPPLVLMFRLTCGRRGKPPLPQVGRRCRKNPASFFPRLDGTRRM